MNSMVRWSAVGAAVMALGGCAMAAQGAPFAARDIRGERVGPGTVLWAHVFRGRPPATSSDCSTDVNTDTTPVPSFALPNASGIAFRPAPADNFSDVWTTVVGSTSFGTWDGPLKGSGYFSFGARLPNAMPKPSKFSDGINYMGMASLKGRTLAVTYTWTRAGRVSESDMFFNSNIDWTEANGTPCPSGSAYDREAIATHELGHVLGFDHLSVLMATMYPSASANETRKRTLTSGEIASAQSIP